MNLHDTEQFSPVTPQADNSQMHNEGQGHTTSVGGIVAVLLISVAAIVAISFLYMKNQADAPVITSYSTEQQNPIPQDINEENADTATAAIDSDFKAAEEDFDEAMAELDAELNAY